MGRTLDEVPARAVSAVDFRRPSRIGRDALLVVESAHDGFVRRLGTSWSTQTHAALELEHVATDQTSVDDYVRALPTPTILGQLRVERLGGATALFELDLPLALLLVERILGGPGDARSVEPTRRPTDLEVALIERELLVPAVAAIDEVLTDLAGDPTSILSVETTPQPMQLAATAELLILLTFRIEVRGDLPAQGLCTIAYPVTPLLAHVDRFLSGTVDAGIDPAILDANRAALLDTEVDVQVQLGGSPLHAGVVAALAPGDVLRLDHHVLQPARLVVSGREVGSAHLGRRGRRLAVQLAGPAVLR